MCGFFKGDGYFRFIDFSFHFYMRYASMENERQLSVRSLPIIFFSIHVLIFLLSHNLCPPISLSFFIESLSNLRGL